MWIQVFLQPPPGKHPSLSEQPLLQLPPLCLGIKRLPLLLQSVALCPLPLCVVIFCWWFVGCWLVVVCYLLFVVCCSLYVVDVVCCCFCHRYIVFGSCCERSRLLSLQRWTSHSNGQRPGKSHPRLQSIPTASKSQRLEARKQSAVESWRTCLWRY